MSYFHPTMNDWSPEEKILARYIDPECWRSFDGLYRGEKDAMGRRRQNSLERARKIISGGSEGSPSTYYPDYATDPNPSPDTQKGPTAMSRQSTNPSIAVFLINKDVRGILCSYEQDASGKPTGTLYLFKTFDQTLKKGDYVVVPTATRHGMTVCRVEEVDVEPDFDSSIDYKWVVDKVDRALYEHTLQQEADAISQIKKAEKRAARDELRKKLYASHEEDLKALPLYKNGDGDNEPAKEPTEPETPQTPGPAGED
jgi:hypothetical protein